MIEVVVTAEFSGWYDALDDQDTGSVRRAVDALEVRGVSLGFPQSSAIKGTRFPLRELRIQSGGQAIRIFYAFDPKRQAVLLLGGVKTSDRFYDQMVPTAERLWTEYLDEAKWK